MGLKERRAIKDFQESVYPDLQKQIFEALGFEPEIEVLWDGLAEEGYDHLYGESLPKVYFQPAIQALSSICADDMGKEAIGESLKKIHIKNEAGNSSPRSWADFSGGVLTLDHKPHSNIDDVKDRAAALQTLLESKL